MPTADAINAIQRKPQKGIKKRVISNLESSVFMLIQGEMISSPQEKPFGSAQLTSSLLSCYLSEHDHSYIPDGLFISCIPYIMCWGDVSVLGLYLMLQTDDHRKCRSGLSIPSMAVASSPERSPAPCGGNKYEQCNMSALKECPTPSFAGLHQSVLTCWHCCCLRKKRLRTMQHATLETSVLSTTSLRADL